MPPVTFISCNNKLFLLEENFAKLSLVISNLLQNLEEGDNLYIKVANMSGEVLVKLSEWGQHHKVTVHFLFKSIK